MLRILLALDEKATKPGQTPARFFVHDDDTYGRHAGACFLREAQRRGHKVLSGPSLFATEAEAREYVTEMMRQVVTCFPRLARCLDGAEYMAAGDDWRRSR